MLATGIKNKIELNVTDKNTAKAVGSGTLEVYATPQMVNLMETCACFSVEPYMEPGKTTVGISLNISHVSATPAGLKVWCESELTAINGRKLTFSVSAYDEHGLIGEGTHERFIVDIQKFMAKTRGKLKQ